MLETPPEIQRKNNTAAIISIVVILIILGIIIWQFVRTEDEIPITPPSPTPPVGTTTLPTSTSSFLD